ncbi:MAG: DUF3263 domain-containing protein [Actinomycetota bacterium]|nr:DUF3263 domain-containing protein [Actinomycetota bacterium]
MTLLAAVLAFARDHHLQGRVSGRVQSQLGLCETRYYQLLVDVLDRPEAAAAEPELVQHLRALRDRRRRLRSAALQVSGTLIT